MTLPDFVTFLQATPLATPSPSPTEQIELLNSQIEFLQASYDRMTTSFNQFVTFLNVIVVVVGLFLGILGLRTRQEMKQLLDEKVRQEVNRQTANLEDLVRHMVNQQIAGTVQARVDDIERMVHKETLIRRTTVGYVWLYSGEHPTSPDELELLKAPGFQVSPIRYEAGGTLPQRHVIVLDLVNANLSEDQRDEAIANTAEHVRSMVSPTVLVVYLSGFSKAILSLPRTLYCIPANSRGTLAAATTNAAQLAFALQG